MPRTKKTRAEKLASARTKAAQPKRVRCKKTGKWLVIPGIPELEALIRRVRPGRVVTIDRITDLLRRRHEVDFCCPMTTGIFTWILAHAADDQAQSGRKRVLPWWRVLKTGGELNPKWPGGGTTQKAKLEAEGHRVVRKGKKLILADLEEAAIQFRRVS